MASDSSIPFFVRLLDHFEDQFKIYIILEFCDSSLLATLRRTDLKEDHYMEMVLQIGIGLNFLHNNTITH